MQFYRNGSDWSDLLFIIFSLGIILVGMSLRKMLGMQGGV